jgi:hypothetical protein
MASLELIEILYKDNLNEFMLLEVGSFCGANSIPRWGSSIGHCDCRHTILHTVIDDLKIACGAHLR